MYYTYWVQWSEVIFLLHDKKIQHIPTCVAQLQVAELGTLRVIIST